MDIPELSMTLSQQNIMQNVGTAVLSKSIDMAESTGAQLTQMIDAAAMERSVNPNVGSNFDMYV